MSRGGHNRVNYRHNQDTKMHIALKKRGFDWKNMLLEKQKSIYESLFGLEQRYCACQCGSTFDCEKQSNKKFISGHNSYLNKHLSSLECKKFGNSGEKNGMFGKRYRDSLEVCIKKQKGIKRMWENMPEGEKQKRVASMLKAQFSNKPACAAQALRSCSDRPNYLERKLFRLLDLLFPKEYKYTGDKTVWLGNRNPDYMNVNGQKKVIEFFGRKWHNEADQPHRIEHYKQYGFKCLVIWSEELKDKEKLCSKLQEFHTAGGVQ